MKPTNVPVLVQQQSLIRAKIVDGNDMLTECAHRLKHGDLVAFPTETVYGLGCNALNANAIHKVFQAKERPLTDPLIVHVAHNEHAFSLWQATANPTQDDKKNVNGRDVTDVSDCNGHAATNTSEAVDRTIEGRVLQALTLKFWPGPLTLVAKACSHVPTELMANTGFVACRRPLHAVASALIKEAGVPIAAPSANKFGHVSPTTAQHVYDDLKYEDVWILNGSGCSVGVESSVAKVETIVEPQQHDTARVFVTLLRQGIVSLADMQTCLEETGLLDHDKIQLQASTRRATSDHVANVAPGQTIRHYSPKIPSYLVDPCLYQNLVTSSVSADDQLYLSKTVLIDFGELLLPWRDHVLAYRDLSHEGAATDAARLLYETLRWAELVEGADRILFPQLLVSNETNAFALAVMDRLTRAASGVAISKLQQ
jgi:tRNA A37 threonylcarbamoyladenosine synthetase subunit TsaC/SUA5/YrdC